ncbi:site-specific DNA-methyltransferase [Pseudarthrobacter sp. Y6]|uniref:site-specific DNA-methyltransferase n=1 Tax=Pseudarthrobacter sp. Y6 TaxID=3418422 RepID=UPI003CF15FDC
MSRLTDLLRAAKQLDPQLGKDLEDEIQPLQKRLPFGLNFERHAPEAVELAGHKIRKESRVRILSPRGSTARGDQRLWRVDKVIGDAAEISLLDSSEAETRTVQVDDLILVAEFRDWIYPGLRPDGTVERGDDKPFHTVINGENFHVLEQLTFTHARSVDAIYIDPPYNTGARDWKYNNDYVEGDDLYRHSKWLAFMERRLKLAERLLKPENSVLIVTIDEKEYLRLGLLLEQTFTDARIQMISTVINPKGVSRGDSFRRSDEYIFFVMLGSAAPQRLELGTEWAAGSFGNVEAGAGEGNGEPGWSSMMRRGSNSARTDRPGLFYPIYVDPDTGRIQQVGAPLSADKHEAPEVAGLIATLPLRRNGSEGRWQIGPDELRSRLSQGRVRTGRKTAYGYVINYLSDGAYAEVLSGGFEITGRAEDGSIVATRVGVQSRAQVPFTQWRTPSHNASEYGSTLLTAFLPGRKFPFPKSLHAVEDALRLFVSDKPEAVVLDFFAGSGTTAHALMRLNRQDGGRRQCISVTNNEVSAEEQTRLRRQRLRPGDAEWERWGICDYITKPRILAAVTGLTQDGEPIKGDYKFVDEFAMADGFEENAAFFTLTYESPWQISADRAFGAIAPMLWLRAGARGRCIDDLSNGWAVAEAYGVIKDLDRSSDFIEALRREEHVRIAFIVTDDEGRYQQIANEIPGVEPVRLYEDYLRNCESSGDF